MWSTVHNLEKAQDKNWCGYWLKHTRVLKLVDEQIFLGPPVTSFFQPPEECKLYSQSCCWRLPARHGPSPELRCHLGEWGYNSQGICPLLILYVMKERHVGWHLCWIAISMFIWPRAWCKVLPSVLHLNPVTVRTPSTFFSATSQSPSTAWWRHETSKWHTPPSQTFIS